MSATIRSFDVLPKIIELGSFRWEYNILPSGDPAVENVEIIEELLGETIDPDTLLGILRAKKVEYDEVAWPHRWESGAEYELYTFQYGGKKYYALRVCNWTADTWICEIDIFDKLRDAKKAIKSFYEMILDKAHDARNIVEDEDILNELEDIIAYARKQIKALR